MQGAKLLLGVGDGVLQGVHAVAHGMHFLLQTGVGSLLLAQIFLIFEQTLTSRRALHGVFLTLRLHIGLLIIPKQFQLTHVVPPSISARPP